MPCPHCQSPLTQEQSKADAFEGAWAEGTTWEPQHAVTAALALMPAEVAHASSWLCQDRDYRGRGSPRYCHTNARVSCGEGVVSGLGPPEDRIFTLGQEVLLDVRRPTRPGGRPAPPAARRIACAAPPAAPPRPSSAAPGSGRAARRRRCRTGTPRRRCRSRASGGSAP